MGFHIYGNCIYNISSELTHVLSEVTGGRKREPRMPSISPVFSCCAKHLFSLRLAAASCEVLGENDSVMGLLIFLNLMIKVTRWHPTSLSENIVCFITTSLSLENYLVTSSFFSVCVQTPNLWSDKCILEWDQIFKGAPTLSYHYFLKFLLFHFFRSSFSVINHQRYKDLPSAFALQPSVLFFTLSLCFLRSSRNEHHLHFIWRTQDENEFCAIKNGFMGSVSLTDSLSEREDSRLLPFSGPLISEDWLVTVARLEEG